MHDAFADLHAQTREILADLGHQWAAGEMSARTFAEAMDEVLIEAHTRAVVIGRTHAGDDAPEDSDDRRFASLIVEEEHAYLQPFREQMEAGRYTGEDGTRDGDAVARRAEKYVSRLTGSANEAWSLTLDPETAVTWRLAEPTESACSDCPELADASPWTPGELPTVPGKNETACMLACRCRLETSGGQRGFVTPG